MDVLLLNSLLLVSILTSSTYSSVLKLSDVYSRIEKIYFISEIVIPMTWAFRFRLETKKLCNFINISSLRFVKFVFIKAVLTEGC